MAVRILWVICILFFGISVVNCCSCASPPSKHQQFCDSNIVVLAFVYNQRVDSSWYYLEYDAVVYSVKRDKADTIPNDDNHFLVKIRMIISCSVSIDLGKSYLFSTTSLDYSQFPPLMYVNTCGWNTKTSSLSQSDLNGIDNWTCPWIAPNRVIELLASYRNKRILSDLEDLRRPFF
ncbi:uncharacterized protein [Apostichopus japonicus]|uniref:uncharacterized protein n=1 Tax=Stichopus japonicus TaxID=307972 RepID=UPI003AB249A0